MTQRFEATLAVYGIPDDAGNVFTRQAAERMAEQAKGMKVDMLWTTKRTHNVLFSRYAGKNMWKDESQGQVALHQAVYAHIIEARLDGDEQQGRVVVTCEIVEETEAHS